MKRVIRNVFVFSLAGILVWLTLIFIAPILKSLDRPLNAFIYSIFDPICHQNPIRCFYLLGNPLAVCTRCLGIYIGFFLGTLFYPVLQGFKTLGPPKNQVFFILSSPIVIDTIGNFLNLWQTSGWLRFAVGLIWGVILPYYFIAGISELFMSRKHFSLKKE